MTWPPASLTARLGLLFGGIAALTFALAGTYLYRSLEQQLMHRDDAELLGKVELVRHLLSEAPSTAVIGQDPHLFRDAIVGHEGLLIHIRSRSNEVLVTNVAPGVSLPELPMVAWDRKPEYTDIATWKTPAGRSGRVVAAEGSVGNVPGQAVQIVVASQASDRAGLLAAYQRDALAAALGGTLMAALLGHVVVSRGLQPVREIAAKARQISASHLDARPQLADAPTELLELAAAFNQMLDRVKDGVDRLSRFSSDLAHELRTPIANLLGETQVTLARPRSVEEYHALLESNVEELERLSRMIDSMLFLARADEARLALRLERMDVAIELHRIAGYFADIAAEAGVRLAVQGSAFVVADSILLRRAVSNLVANAIRYTPSGGEVTMSAIQRPEQVAISVRNPGPAIALEVQARIFDRFYRGDESRPDSTSSSGLGLAIVRSIMQLHRGEASVRSTLEDGTEFELLFRMPV